ncbi:MAG: hypothetical protein ACHP9Z_34290 [Streptosporangiales bacterium]
MRTITRAQYDAGLDAICDRHGHVPSGPKAARLNEELERFKRSVIVEAAPDLRAATAIAEAAIAKHEAARTARKAARRAVREQGLTAAAVLGRQPPPAVPAAAVGALADKPLHEMSRDELASVAVAGTTGASPFMSGLAGPDTPMRSPFWQGMTGA